MRRQQVGHAADLAPAHRVRLAGERERAGAGPADLARRQVQVDQRRVLRRSARALVEPLAIERQVACARARVALANQRAAWTRSASAMPHRRADVLRREVAHARLQRLEAAGVRGDVGGVEPAFPEHHVQHAVQQRDVGAGLDREVQVGDGGGLGAARIDDDDLQRRVARLRVLDAAKQDRVRERGVRAGDEERRRVGDVVVAARRRVGAERRLVAGDRARHAKARVGVDVVGADQALGELVEDVVVLGKELARDVERDGVGSVRRDASPRNGRRRGRARRPSRRGCGAAPRDTRRCGRSSRVCIVTACVTVRCSVLPLLHRCPKLAGWSGSPRTPVIGPPSFSMITPQPTPQ